MVREVAEDQPAGIRIVAGVSGLGFAMGAEVAESCAFRFYPIRAPEKVRPLISGVTFQEDHC